MSDPICQHSLSLHDLAKAWEAGWRTGVVYGYWAQREDVSDAADIDLRANPYGTSVPQKGSK